MDNIQEKVEKLKKAIETELSFCNPIDTPYICPLMDNETDKEKIINTIVSYVANEGITISNAIAKLETELNPNYIPD